MKSKEELKQQILDKLNQIRPYTSEEEKNKLREEINNKINKYINK